MAFRVNQKVVCVDPVVDWDGVYRITKGGVYTISDLLVSWDGFPAVILAEVPVRVGLRGGLATELSGIYAAYRQYRFRPLTERKTSTGYEILEEIRKRESLDEPSKVDLPADCEH